MTDKTAAQILTEAADIIDRNGWIQNRYYDIEQAGDGTPKAECRVCLLGALNIAMHGKPTHLRDASRPDFFWVLMRAVEREADAEDAVDWNDTEGRTQDEVTALLRAVAGKVDF